MSSPTPLLPQRRRGTLGGGPQRRPDVADLGPLQSDGEGAMLLGMVGKRVEFSDQKHGVDSKILMWVGVWFWSKNSKSC